MLLVGNELRHKRRKKSNFTDHYILDTHSLIKIETSGTSIIFSAEPNPNIANYMTFENTTFSYHIFILPAASYN
jgi:hypothetical protein